MCILAPVAPKQEEGATPPLAWLLGIPSFNIAITITAILPILTLHKQILLVPDLSSIASPSRRCGIVSLGDYFLFSL